ncbi:hypothetical protein [Sphingomonas aurantiaca]|uniref:hypothetical protein n=1 Tax=Sphingomonas aurantiaca TaxID=185949 RepID=UPI000D373342|nr:hypothetical protein [Sphingomonas aurantiaca]
MDDAALLESIEAFCRAHGISDAKFGLLALNDWKLVRDLRGEKRTAPRRLWPETQRQIFNFMALYVADGKGAVDAGESSPRQNRRKAA